jgi:hypothetical protein
MSVSRFVFERDVVATKSAVKKKRTKNFRLDARRELAKAWELIVNVLISRTKEGSYNHAKLLMELSGVLDDEVKPARRRSSLTQLLMKKLGEKEAGDGKS